MPGNRKKNSGYKYMAAKPGAKAYTPSRAVQERLPKKVDLRRHMTSIENQGEVGSCTANAIAGAYEYLIKKHHGETIDISRLFVYYNARLRDDSQDVDEGSYIQYGVESLGRFGACRESVWPYDESKVFTKPGKSAYADATKFKTLDFEQVPLKLDAWKQALAEGYPVIFGCMVFNYFDDICEEDEEAIVRMPYRSEAEEGGGHAMLCVGYSDVDEVFIIRNSWGAEWGDRGYCYMPYSYLMSKRLNDGDCWIIRSIDTLPEPAETWVDDDDSLFSSDRVRQVNRESVDLFDEFAKLFSNADGSRNEYTAIVEGARWLSDLFAGESDEDAEAGDEEEYDEDAEAEDEAEYDEDAEAEDEEEYDEDAEAGDEEEYDEDAEAGDEEEYDEDAEAEDEEEYDEDAEAEEEEETSERKRRRQKRER